MTILLVAALSSPMAGPLTAGEKSALYSEVPDYLAATEDHLIPLPEKVPVVETALRAAAAQAAAGHAPSPLQAEQAARLALLDSIRRAHKREILDLESVMGVGIGRNESGFDWELVVLATPGVPLEEARADFAALGVVESLQGFSYRLEETRSAQLTANERPGKTRIWRSPIQNTCTRTTMGWLAQSNQSDETDGYGNGTGRQSVGYLTVLHGTAHGPQHIWEDFGDVPREVAWGVGSCSGSVSGRTLRLGPHFPGTTYGDIDQDIDFVSLEFRKACNQADNYQETGMPDCPNFPAMTVGYNFEDSPVDLNEAGNLVFARAQICGAQTQDVREGELDGVFFALQIPMLDYNGDPVLDGGAQLILELEDMWQIFNEPSDPAFSQPGDSGAPVWTLDLAAAGGSGAWRPLGVQSTRIEVSTGFYSYVTPLPANLEAYDVDLVFDNPRNPDLEPCSSGPGGCCLCEPARYGLTAQDGWRLLETARGASKVEVARLTELAVRHESELRALEKAPGADEYGDLFAATLAPMIRDAFAAPEERRRFEDADVRAALQGLAWGYHTVESAELRREASKMYRFLAAYGAGRTVQDVVRLYLQAGEEGVE